MAEKQYDGLEQKVGLLMAQRDDKPRAELTIPEAELCARYERLYTGAVSDILREMANVNHTLPHNIMPLRDEMKVAGPAFTIKSTQDPTIRGEMDTRAKMLDALYEGCICVWETGGDDVSAHWGEVMTKTAKGKGARGAVVDGGLRDTMQVLPQQFPVFYKYRTPNGSLSRCKMIGFEKAIRIGTVIVHPGDIIFGDIDGVVVVPREVACEVLLKAEEKKGDEAVFMSWVEDGMSAQEIVDKGGYF